MYYPRKSDSSLQNSSATAYYIHIIMYITKNIHHNVTSNYCSIVASLYYCSNFTIMLNSD